jgi:hypothetical protein
MKFSLFRKTKQEPQTVAEASTPPPQEQPKMEAATPSTEASTAAEPQQTSAAPMEAKPEVAEPQAKTYLKAMPLKTMADVENVKSEVKNGNIIILRVTPLASKSIEDVKNAVNELTQFTESVGGDIARLGEERVVICPKNIRIWREKSPVQSDVLPTAAPTAA